MIAAQTLAELEAMPLKNGWGLRWAEIQANAKRVGRPISVADSWIAATALRYDAPLITHNPSDFFNVPGLTVITEK
jgi:tRNA(fMet)-specific endonuclease VapC